METNETRCFERIALGERNKLNSWKAVYVWSKATLVFMLYGLACCMASPQCLTCNDVADPQCITRGHCPGATTYIGQHLFVYPWLRLKSFEALFGLLCLFPLGTITKPETLLDVIHGVRGLAFWFVADLDTRWRWACFLGFLSWGCPWSGGLN